MAGWYNRERELATWNDFLRELGYLTPENEGFWTALGQGIKYTTYSIFAPDELETNQHLRPAPEYDFAGGAGRFIGQWLFYPLVIAAIVACIVLLVKRKQSAPMREAARNIQKTALSEAVEELKNGKADPAAWGEAVIKAKGSEAKARALYLKIRSKG